MTAEFPGFLITAEGGYITVDDFLSFVAGASPGQSDTKTRAIAWLKKQGVSGSVESLSRQEVSPCRGGAEGHRCTEGTGKTRDAPSRRAVAAQGPAARRTGVAG
jgi:hypothetical protein